MIKNLLINSLRYLKSKPLYSGINIAALSMGIICSLAIFQYVIFEYSFDKFHANASDIYRVRLDNITPEGVRISEATCYPFTSKTMMDEFPEVINATTLVQKGMSKGTFSTTDQSNNEVRHYEEDVFFTDSEFFQIFSFEFILRASNGLLNEPHTAVITESAALKYFGRTEVLGQLIQRNGTELYKITGIVKDPPVTSHINFTILLSFETFKQIRPDVEQANKWSWWGFYNYAQLAPDTDIEALEAKFPDFITKYIGKDELSSIDFKLQPMLDIHLKSHLIGEIESNSDASIVNTLSFVALIILLLAWINYVNFSSSQASSRQKDVAIKKALGSSSKLITIQLLLEALILNIIAFLVAYLFLFLFSQQIYQLVNVNFPLFNPTFYLLALIFIIIGTVVSGVIPFVSLLNMKPAQLLKGKSKNTTIGSGLRKGLVIFQFVITSVMIAGISVIYLQIDFMKNQNLNVNTKNILVVQSPNLRNEIYHEVIQSFKNEVIKNTDFEKISVASAIPGTRGWSAGRIRRLGQDENEEVQLENIHIDEDFIELFGLNLLAGTNFGATYENNANKVILTETAIKTLGYDDPANTVGQKIIVYGEETEIIGVINDYHHLSLKENLSPIMLRVVRGGRDHFSFKSNQAITGEKIEKIKELWDKVFPGNTFNYSYLDLDYNKQYSDDITLQNAMSIFSNIALIISCLGIFGLASYNLAVRSKELSIRKVLGAKSIELYNLLLKEYLLLVVIASGLAVPISYYIQNAWLDNYSYKVSVSPLLLALPCVISILLVFITISYHSIKSALINPIHNLRSE